MQSHTFLKRKTALKAKTSLSQKTEISPVSKKRASHLRTVEYKSIFTDHMDVCYITGDTKNVDPHHIFGGADKASSELFHFMLPLRRDWHTLADYSIHKDRQFALKMKLKCQKYWIETLHKTLEEWLMYFRKWYVEEEIRKVS